MNDAPKISNGERMSELKLTVAVCAVVLVATGLLIWFGKFAQPGDTWQGICWAIVVATTGYTGGRSFVKTKAPRPLPPGTEQPKP